MDIETLKQTNESLISTLDEVLKIQAEAMKNARLPKPRCSDWKTN